MVEYEYVDQVEGVYVSKGSVYVSKEMSPYHHPPKKCLFIFSRLFSKNDNTYRIHHTSISTYFC